ncbi:hypothetical protein B0H14DRAFT_3870298 [Mycena olivaceomarginata]|nr:hypothetical protein B0H14DRAFT_3870298 [Mycena olivaceomarginata]
MNSELEVNLPLSDARHVCVMALVRGVWIAGNHRFCYSPILPHAHLLPLRHQMKRVTSADWDNSVGILPHRRETSIPWIVARGVDVGDQLRLRHVGLRQCRWRHRISGGETISRAIAEKGMPPPSRVTRPSSPVHMDPVVLPHRAIWPCCRGFVDRGLALQHHLGEMSHFCWFLTQAPRLGTRPMLDTPSLRAGTLPWFISAPSRSNRAASPREHTRLYLGGGCHPGAHSGCRLFCCPRRL